jgi:hypothetical protein
MGVAMSNQRSFKIESFRFAAFVPKKIEYIRFFNKILDQNKTFSMRNRKFWSKSFCFGPFPNFLGITKSFLLSLKSPGAISNVLVSF